MAVADLPAAVRAAVAWPRPIDGAADRWGGRVGRVPAGLPDRLLHAGAHAAGLGDPGAAHLLRACLYPRQLEHRVGLCLRDGGAAQARPSRDPHRNRIRRRDGRLRARHQSAVVLLDRRRGARRDGRGGHRVAHQDRRSAPRAPPGAGRGPPPQPHRRARADRARPARPARPDADARVAQGGVGRPPRPRRSRPAQSPRCATWRRRRATGWRRCARR